MSTHILAWVDPGDGIDEGPGGGLSGVDIAVMGR